MSLEDLKRALKHMAGKHPQKSHAGGRGGSMAGQKPEGSRLTPTAAQRTFESDKKAYPRRMETVGRKPRSKKEVMRKDVVTVPAGVKLSDNFRRNGLARFGQPGTEGTIEGSETTTFTLRNRRHVTAGPAAFSKDRSSLVEFADNLGWVMK